MVICINCGSVTVKIPEDKVRELEGLCLQMVSCNVISRKVLHKFAGKAMSIASVIYTWRPFIHQVHAALSSDAASNGPSGCIWTSQVRNALLWFLAFFDSLKLHLNRTWTLDGFIGAGPCICIVWDASPWGFGAVLLINEHPVEFWADQPGAFETDLLSIIVGDCESQQVLECLAGLVALRVWARHWQHRRITLALRSDNIGALVLLSRLKTTSSRNALIAREFALDLGDASFKPDIAEHIPGFANKCCDALSRLCDPTFDNDTPPLLANVRRVDLPPRERSWWRSVSPPQLRREASGN